MHNLDDLINNISMDEAIELPGSLTNTQKNRIESNVLAEIYSDSSKLVKYRRIPRRKRMILVLAAMFVLLFGITSAAASENEWDILLTNFMGLNDASTLQLESGEVQINATAKSNGLEITKITSIGDKNTAYIRMDTNYELPEDFDETKDYILPENHSTNITDQKNDVTKTHASALTCFYEDNKLGFLLEISNCENLNKSYVSLDFENLILYHDLHVYDDSAPEEELLFTGHWTLDWKYSYKSSTITHRMLKKMDILENTVWITKVDVSPISIRFEGKRSPLDFNKAWGGSLCIQEIHFKNGDVIRNPAQASGGHSNTTFEYYINIHGMEQVIDPNELDYIIMGNQKIDF